MAEDRFQPPQIVKKPEASNTLADQDLRGALHDVANALTLVLGWLDLACKEAQQDQEEAHRLRVAQDWARHGRGIALRAIGARSKDSDTPVDLASLLRDVVIGTEPQAARRNISIQVVNSASGGEALQGWPLALQVLTNLLLNAIDFSPSGAEVAVRASVQPPFVQLVIADQGPGVDPNLRRVIFDGVPSSRPGGSGIGLAHSRFLALSQGGSVQMIESETGAAFEVLWPLSTDRPRTPAPVPRRTSLAGKRVLVFDDDAAVLSLIQTGLEARGAEVVTAADVSALSASMRAGPFDAALIDLSPLAGDSGKALSTMRLANPQVRVVLISGSAVPPPAEALDAAKAWVRKPFEMGEIVAAILGDE